jgi:hypothetical protein
MRQVLKLSALLLLLTLTQQGAVMHEIGHLRGADSMALHVDGTGSAEATCPLCLMYAQAMTPAFSYRFPLTDLAPFTSARQIARATSVAELKTFKPRSRGPPATS